MRRYELDTSYQGNMPNEVEFTLDNRYVVKIGEDVYKRQLLHLQDLALMHSV